jgi:hypothetical protein
MEKEDGLVRYLNSLDGSIRPKIYGKRGFFFFFCKGVPLHVSTVIVLEAVKKSRRRYVRMSCGGYSALS